jgi:hypothetical protein
MTFKLLPLLEINPSDIYYGMYKYANYLYDEPVTKEKKQELFREYLDCLKIEQEWKQRKKDKEDIRQKQISNFIISA